MSVTNLFLDGDISILTADISSITKLFTNMGVSATEAVNIVSSIDLKTNHATKLYPIDMGRYVKNADDNVCKRFSTYITNEVLRGVLRDPMVDYAKVSVVNIIDENNNVDKYRKTNLDTLLGFSSESGIEHNVYWVDRNITPVTNINNCSVATEYVNSLNGTKLTSDLEKCIDTLRWSGSDRVGDDANKQDTYCRKYFVNVNENGRNETISDTPTENAKYIHACEKLTYSADVSEVTGLDKVPFSNPQDQSYSLADEFTTPNYYCTDNWVIEEFMHALQLNKYDYYDISDSGGLSYSVSQTEKNGYGNPKIIINNNTNGKFINDINTLYGGIARQKSIYDIANTYTGKDGAKASFNDYSQRADRWGHNNTIVYSDIKSSNSVSEAYKDGEIYKKKWQFVDENLRHDFYKDRESIHKLEYDDTEFLPNATYKFDYDKENGLGIYFPIKEVISEEQSYILPYESFDVIWAHRWDRHNTVDFMRGDYGVPILVDGKNKYPWDGTRMVIDRNMPSAKSEGFKYKHGYNIIVKYTTGHYSSTDPCTNKNIESHGESYKDGLEWKTRDNVFTNNSKGLENILKTYCTDCNYQHYEKNADFDMKTKYNVDTLTSISDIYGNIDKYTRSASLEGTSALSGIANYYCKDQSVKDKLAYCFTSNMPIGTHPTTSTSSVTVSAARVATNVDLDVIHDHCEDTPIYLTTYNSYNNTPVISKTNKYPRVSGTPSNRNEYVIEDVGNVTLSGTQYNALSGSVTNTSSNWNPEGTHVASFDIAVNRRITGTTGTIWWNVSSELTKPSEPIKDADGNITGHTSAEYKHTYSYLGESAVTGTFSVTATDTIYYIGSDSLAKDACNWNLRYVSYYTLSSGVIVYNLTEMKIPVTKYWKRSVGTAKGYFAANSTTCMGDPVGSVGTAYYAYSNSNPSQAVRDRLKICQGISSLSNISVSTLSEGYRYIITDASTRSYSFDYVKTNKTASSYVSRNFAKMNMFTSIQYYDDLVYHLQSSGWTNMIDLATFNTTTDNIVYQVKTVSSLSCAGGYLASGVKYEYAEDNNTELWQFDVSKADEIFGDNDNTYTKGEPKIQYGYLPKRVDDGTVNANYTPWTPSHIYKASFNEDNYTYTITDSTDLKDTTAYHFHGRFTFYYKSYSYYYTYFSGSTLSIWNSRVRTMLHFWMQLHARKADVTYINQYNEHTLSDYYNAGNAPDDKREGIDTPQVYIEYNHGVTTLYSSKTGKANDIKMSYGLKDNDEKEFPVMVSPFGKEKMGYTKSLGSFRLFTMADDHIHIASITNDGMKKDTNALITQVNVSYTRPELTVNVGGKLGGLTIVLPKGYIRSRPVGPNEDIKNQFGVPEYEKDAEVTLEKGHYVRYIVKDANGNDKYEESYDENGNKVSNPVYGYNPIENLSDDNKLEVTETYHKKNADDSSKPGVSISVADKENPDYEILPDGVDEQYYADTKRTLINDPMLYETVEVTISVNGTQVYNKALASEFTDSGNREYTAPSYANTVTIKYSLKNPVNPDVTPTTITIYNNRQGTEPDVSNYILKNRLLYFVGSILNN